MIRSISKDILFGVAVGDALGVPVEFKTREEIALNPVIDMIGYGTYNLPPGSWSDDSSLTFCLAEALTQNFSLDTIARNFIKWRDEAFWTPFGKVFDIGIATNSAISRVKSGVQPEKAGGTKSNENGNGSLMRILPLVLYIKDKVIEDRYQITKQVSSITHGHIRSVIACFYYSEFAGLFAKGVDKFEAYKILQSTFREFLSSQSIDEYEISKFHRLLKENIFELSQNDISSTGYVLHTLEASIWCLLTTSNYREATLKAVNLGFDTDTTAAVTGGLAGLLYGFPSIPVGWMNQLAKKDEIMQLAEALDDKYNKFH